MVIRELNGRAVDILAGEDFQLMGWKEETYYAPVNAQGVARIVEEHIGGDQIIIELLGDPSKEPPKI